ncbi:MAG TPA: hypothetical protein VGH99_22455 [Pseudonocardia sp.]
MERGRPDGVAWVVTLPAAALVGALAGQVAGLGIAGTVIVALVVIAAALGIFLASRKQPITADNVNDAPEAAGVPVPTVTV